MAIIKQVAAKTTKEKYPEFVVWTNRNVMPPKATEWAKLILEKYPKCVVHGKSGTVVMTRGWVMCEEDYMIE